MLTRHARLSIKYRDKTPQEIEGLFLKFTEELTELAGSDKFSKMFVVSKSEAHAFDKTNKAELQLPTRVIANTYFVTRKPIDDFQIFERVLKLLKEWISKQTDKVTIEINANFIKMPLYFRNGEFHPARTFYDLGLVGENDLKLISAINELIK